VEALKAELAQMKATMGQLATALGVMAPGSS